MCAVSRRRAIGPLAFQLASSTARFWELGAEHSCGVTYGGLVCWGGNEQLQSAVPSAFIRTQALVITLCLVMWPI